MGMIKEIKIELNTTFRFKDEIAACIGYFDGFHIGHQMLFKSTLSLAKASNLKSAIISFEPDPWVVIKNLSFVSHISTIEDRKYLAEHYGFDYWITLVFNHEMADASPQQFIQLLNGINIKHLICGYDFRFGKNGAGDIQTLKSQNELKIQVIDEFDFNNEKVSTTRIIAALKAGEIELANTLLGRPYSIRGLIIHGKQLGQKIGYPTANLLANPEYIIPKIGVYAGRVNISGKLYNAMISIGINPTISNDNPMSIEAHIFDYYGNLYDMNLIFEFHYYLRDEMRFDNIQGLINQLKLDDLESRKRLI